MHNCDVDVYLLSAYCGMVPACSAFAFYLPYLFLRTLFAFASPAATYYQIPTPAYAPVVHTVTASPAFRTLLLTSVSSWTCLRLTPVHLLALTSPFCRLRASGTSDVAHFLRGVACLPHAACRPSLAFAATRHHSRMPAGAGHCRMPRSAELDQQTGT